MKLNSILNQAHNLRGTTMSTKGDEKLKAKFWDKFIEIYNDWLKVWYAADDTSTFINSMQFLKDRILNLVKEWENVKRRSS